MDDFIATARRLADVNEERVNGLLDDVLGSESTSLTEEHVEQAGGREAVISEIL